MDLSAIRTDARYLVSPQLTSTQYSNTDLDRNANHWYKKIVGWALAVQGDWQIGGEIIYRDLDEGVDTYALPDRLLRIYKGEVRFETGGDFVPLTFYDVQANQDSVEGNATRVFDDVTKPTADLMGTNIVVRPTPTEDVTNGIKLWAQLMLSDMTDSNEIPEILEPVHRGISIGAAMDYCEGEEMWPKFRELKYQMFGDPRVKNDEGVKGEIERLYAVRSAARRHSVQPRRRSYK